MAILAEPTGRVRSVVQQPGATLLVTDEGEVAVSAVAAPGAAIHLAASGVPAFVRRVGAHR